jgi:CRISPR-associated endonuclease/helicase Cas3
MTKSATRCSPESSAMPSIGYSPNGRDPAHVCRSCALSPRPPELLDLLPRAVVCPACGRAARLDPPPLPKLSPREADALAWWLAGLTVAADWVGSNTEAFPPEPFAIALATYWLLACGRAGRAVQHLGLGRSPLTPDVLITTALFTTIPAPRPLQSWAETAVLPKEPCLVVIEDATGSGKTEAALVLAHRMMVAGLGHGFYAALPTLATADAMYRRIADVYPRLFAPDADPSLVLAHGARNANAAFRASIAGPADPDDDPDDPDAPVAAQCSAWIADDRRKAFLAEIGVGTLDQAVLGVLPSRHSLLRLTGLAQRILIVDEAHAYDAYVSEELATLLRFHAALGGSAIVLSATLTATQRSHLIDAYRSGLGAEPTPAPVTVAYPLVTIASAPVLSMSTSASRRNWHVASRSSAGPPPTPSCAASSPRRRQALPLPGSVTPWTTLSKPPRCCGRPASSRWCSMPASPWGTGWRARLRCCTASAAPLHQPSAAARSSLPPR